MRKINSKQTDKIMSRITNPFITNGYRGAEYFCDRETETAQLTSLLINGNNVALISPRRIGKTDLIQHCFAQAVIKENFHPFIIDIYATKSLSDLVRVLSYAILKELVPRGQKAWRGFVSALSSLRSELTLDENGMPSWGIGLGDIPNPVLTLDEIFDFMARAERPCLVAIDEFQQISRYNDGEDVEAILRAHIQKCANANFIFSGSQRHLMDEMFTSPSRPFYQSVTLFNLQPIPILKYAEFCIRHFRLGGKELDDAVVKSLYDTFSGTTAYMQRVMNLMYESTPEGRCCHEDGINKAIARIFELSNDTYENLLYQIPAKQQGLLRAIAFEREAKNITSGAFTKKYRLLSPSAVASAAKGLLDRDLITVNKGVYMVNDLLFGIWLRQRQL